MFEIIRSMSESDRNTDFVAIGNLINENFESTHCSFIIQFEKEIFLFHYTGYSVEYCKNSESNYYHRITDTISSEEVPAFIAHCRNINKHANPTYGFFYSGEYYDKSGVHFGSQDLSERMTCVGFCLNVLKGFLEDEYICYSDWSEDTHNDPGYLERYCTKNNIDINTIKSSHRRISPRECLTSCFFTKLPITKEQIDSKIMVVNNFFHNLFLSQNN